MDCMKQHGIACRCAHTTDTEMRIIFSSIGGCDNKQPATTYFPSVLRLFANRIFVHACILMAMNGKRAEQTRITSKATTTDLYIYV